MKKKYLQNKIQKLYEHNYISKEQLEKISLEYNLNSKVLNNFIIKILSFVFLALALLVILAYNWEDIPKITRFCSLIVLLASLHFLIYFFKNKNSRYAECFGILANFVLLANFGLLSQMYHLGDDTAMAFLSVGWASLLIAWALKSFYIFVQAYIFSFIGFIIDLSNILNVLYIFDSNQIFHTSFIFFIVMGFLIQKYFQSKFLIFFNFISLGIYCFNAPFFIFFLEHTTYLPAYSLFSYTFLYFLWYTLLMSYPKSYKKISYFFFSCTLLCLSLPLSRYTGCSLELGLQELYKQGCLNFSFHLPHLDKTFWFYSLPLIFFIILNIIKKHYFLTFFALSLIFLTFIRNGNVLSKWGYACLSLLFCIYLIHNGNRKVLFTRKKS